MASAPQQPTLPLFYKDLMPLNSRDHAKWRSKPMESANWLAGHHAIPLTVEEFIQAQRDYPIVFSAGDNPVPLALMGLNEGVNTFVDENGKINDPVYIPAYIRRYPFLLAKLKQDTDDLSLCFDPSAETIGEFDEGSELFDDEGQPSEATKGVLQFCERFEQAGERTKNFIEELVKNELLMDGEIAITQNENPDNPYVYRGFRMIDEQKLRDLRGDLLRTWNQNGMLLLIYAHLFSLDLMRMIFSRQVSQGKGPKLDAAAPA
jgi:hypothetical protein